MEIHVLKSCGSERRFLCRICCKTFKRKYHLQRHLISHTRDNIPNYPNPYVRNTGNHQQFVITRKDERIIQL
uniref:CSON004613 protein n=1 Tax=Culicoides sonorensis TaxID=179676 RepID=A0A336L494_CULSO